MAPSLIGRPPLLARATDPLWRVLRHERTLAVIALLLLLLLALPVLFPQMPGQVREDPASATRWLNTEAGDWGAFGGVLRALGLFHVYSSPLFVLLTALLLLVCLVQLADTVSTAREWRLLPNLLRDRQREDDALPESRIVLSTGLVRRRATLSQEPQSVLEQVEGHLRNSEEVVRLAAIDDSAGDSSQAGAGQAANILAMTNHWYVWLKPLLPLGVLLALAGLWFTARTGWDVHVDALAPGEVTSFAEHAVTLDWTASGDADTSNPLSVTVGTAVGVVGEVPKRTRVGGAGVAVRSGPPALSVRAEGGLLGLPGDDEPRTQVGVVLQEPGNEQFVLLPEQGSALRLLRLSGSTPTYLAEVYGPNAETPLSRIVISGTADTLLETAREGVSLTVAPTSGVIVDVRSNPGLWLVIPGLLLAAAGAIPLLLRPRFLVATVSSWPRSPATPVPHLAAVTLQGTDRHRVDAVALALGFDDSRTQVESAPVHAGAATA